MRGNLYSKPLRLRPGGKESLCPVTLALFQKHIPRTELRARSTENREGWGGGGGRPALLLVSSLLVCRAKHLKEKVTRLGFRRNLCIRDY